LDKILGNLKERKPKQVSDSEIPFLVEGTRNFPIIERSFDKMILNEKNGIDIEKLKEKLRKRVVRFYEWLSKDNEEYPPCEANFYIGCKKALTILKANGYKVYSKFVTSSKD
jgi:hypothetical protein